MVEQNIQVEFPNGASYSLRTEKCFFKKCGVFFPSSAKEKNLFVTGVSGSGKSTLVEKLCIEDKIPYFRQVFVGLADKPKIVIYNNRNDIPEISNDFVSGLRYIDGHFVFIIPELNGKDILFAHDRRIRYSEYEELKLNFNCKLDSLFETKLAFEFRQLDPDWINDAKKIRSQREFKDKTNLKAIHGYSYIDREGALKGQYLFYQVAHWLFEQNVDVYIRTSVDGMPMRFAE